MSDIAQFAGVVFVAYIMCCSSLDIQVVSRYICSDGMYPQLANFTQLQECQT
jgi:hypothetical protein